ncbi:MAG: MBL fold metallo-hydrolase, partial [Verrucomicrobiaceae bacterium]
AHTLELPYLTGRSSYPPPDPSVGGGCMSLMSGLYPKKPIDLGHQVRPLPTDGNISQLPGWRWIHTPGHTAGHISLFREEDRALIVGDAFVTLRAESMLANISRTPELNGPPMYFTPDWNASRESVHLLSMLEPEVVATGHGIPLSGEEMRKELHDLSANFELCAVPDQGRYLREPAISDGSGVVSLPPKPGSPTRTTLLMLGGLLAGFALGMKMAPRPKMRWRDLFS